MSATMMDTIRAGALTLAMVGFVLALAAMGWLFILGFIDAFRTTDRAEWTARDQDALDALDDADVIRDAHGNECSVTCPECGKDVRYFVRAGLVRCAFCGNHEQQ